MSAGDTVVLCPCGLTQFIFHENKQTGTTHKMRSNAPVPKSFGSAMRNKPRLADT
jgi:hypothetical protein